MPNRDHTDESHYQCRYCTDLCYFSFMVCVDHMDSDQSDSADGKEMPKLMSRKSGNKEEVKQESKVERRQRMMRQSM